MMKTWMLCGFIWLLGTGVYAQETPRADVRQGVQRSRIAAGRADGSITRSEAAALRAQQRHIRRVERRAKADGRVTWAEKRRLERKQDRASRRIRQARTQG